MLSVLDMPKPSPLVQNIDCDLVTPRATTTPITGQESENVCKTEQRDLTASMLTDREGGDKNEDDQEEIKGDLLSDEEEEPSPE